MSENNAELTNIKAYEMESAVAQNGSSTTKAKYRISSQDPCVCVWNTRTNEHISTIIMTTCSVGRFYSIDNNHSKMTASKTTKL